MRLLNKKFHISFTLLLISAGLSAIPAAAAPTMTVDVESYQNDYIPSNVGNELQCIYVVTNTSEPLAENKMLDFTLSAGSNHGVYDAIASNGWTFQIMPDSTRFISGGYTPLLPGQQMVLELYSTNLNVHNGFATANALEGQFTPVQISVPGEYPHTLSADIYFDGIVNLLDFAILAEDWMEPRQVNVPSSGSVNNGDVQYDWDINMGSGQASLMISNIGTTPLTEFKLNIADVLTYGTDPDVWQFNPESGTAKFSITGGSVGCGNSFLIDYTFNKDLVELTFDKLEYDGAFSQPGSLENIVTLKQISEPPAGDITNDGIVDFNDLKLMSDQWLMTESWYELLK